MPKLKSIGVGKADCFGGTGWRGSGRTAVYLGSGRGGGGIKACSVAGGEGGGGGIWGGGTTGSVAAGTEGVGAGGVAAGGVGAGGVGAGGFGAGGGAAGVGAAGGGAAGGGAAGGGGSASAVGGTGGVGSGASCMGGSAGAGGADGAVCCSGFDSVGPCFRPLSNSIVTVEGGGNSSGCRSRRIVTSNKMPSVTWINNEIRTAMRSRRGRLRGDRPASESIRRNPVSGMAGSYRCRSRNTPCSPNRLAIRDARRHGPRRPASSAANHCSTA